MRWPSVWIFAWLWLSGCSVLVDPESLVIKCDISPGLNGKDPCLPAGMHCVASECKPCKGAVEICNGLDDDCDGVIDNGFDEDGDGFTWCGGGIAALADCAPDDPTIHPAGLPGPDGVVTIPAPKELCDGKDNDCDSKVDEAPECASMHTCVQDGCPSDQRCDATMGVCIEPRPVGSGCQGDSDCDGGFCVKPSDFGLHVQLSDARCATACCTDADCTSGSVCAVSDTGARLCLPSNIAARASKQSGDLCSLDTECASGVCDRTRCATRCFADNACKGNVCELSVGSLSEPRMWLCGDAMGRDAGGSLCTVFDPTACRSGLCTDRNLCAKACGRNADCNSDEICGYDAMHAVLVGPSSSITLCQARPTGSANDTLCCTNTDCGTGQLCEPNAVDTGIWVMSCH
jgi:hypothetical protein